MEQRNTTQWIEQQGDKKQVKLRDDKMDGQKKQVYEKQQNEQNVISDKNNIIIEDDQKERCKDEMVQFNEQNNKEDKRQNFEMSVQIELGGNYEQQNLYDLNNQYKNQQNDRLEQPNQNRKYSYQIIDQSNYQRQLIQTNNLQIASSLQQQQQIIQLDPQNQTLSNSSLQISITKSPQSQSNIQPISPNTYQSSLNNKNANHLKNQNSSQLNFVKKLNYQPHKPGKLKYQSKVFVFGNTNKQQPTLINGNIHNLDQNIKSMLIQGQQISTYQPCSILSQKQTEDGYILVSNFRIIFLKNTIKILDLPNGFIFKVQKFIQKGPNNVYTIMEISTKYGLLIKFRFIKMQTSDRVFKSMIQNLTFIIHKSFAFNFAKFINNKKQFFANLAPEIVAEINGWKIYNWVEQYQRMNVPLQINQYFQVINNQMGRYCASYPQKIIVPAKLNGQIIGKCMAARSRQRIPILSYAVRLKQQQNIRFICLWRANYLKIQANNFSRNYADQQYLKTLGCLKITKQMQNKQKNLLIIDIKVKGNLMNSSTKIYFPIDNYRNATLKTVQLDSYPSIRQAYYKIFQASLNNEPIKWLKQIQSSKWYQQINLLIKQAYYIASSINQKNNVLVQCSQNMDRVSELCALAQIILDPYYRTHQGFYNLIEKQFNSFGHQFSIRLGFKKQKQQQRSPTFIQFLDCVHQLIIQYPLSFQYTSKFLAKIALESYTNKYGNFLTSSQKQQVQNKIYFNTISIWMQIKNEKNLSYWNPYYVSHQQTDVYFLRLYQSIKKIVFWQDHFLTIPIPFNNFRNKKSVEQNDQLLKNMHRLMKRQTQDLRKKVANQYNQITQLKKKLQELIQ